LARGEFLGGTQQFQGGTAALTQAGRGANAWRGGSGEEGHGGLLPRKGERKHFFFEKKKQKTFVLLVAAFPGTLAPALKVFWFPPGGRRLFFKKELLPSLRPRVGIRAASYIKTYT
jgi:hypothetical protein